MESTSALILDLPQLIWFTVALAAALVGFATYRRGRAVVDSQPGSRAPANNIVYRDAPTVRVVDSERFDRLRRIVRLAPGEHIDLMQAHPVVGPRFRLTLNAITTHDTAEAAHLSVIYAGTQLSCGPLSKELGFNEFLVPRASRDASRSAVFHYRESGDVLDFMRIKVRAIEADANTVEFEVVHTRGKWPGAGE